MTSTNTAMWLAHTASLAVAAVFLLKTNRARATSTQQVWQQTPALQSAAHSTAETTNTEHE